MANIEDCIKECQDQAARYRNALDEGLSSNPRVRDGWRKKLEIYEMLEKAVMLMNGR
jgi:hypothetical protein